MKKAFNILHIVIVLLTVISLFTSASSISFSERNATNTSFFNTQSLSTTSNQKISDIPTMINETIISEYMETIVGFGSRMAESEGCEKAAAIYPVNDFYRRKNGRLRISISYCSTVSSRYQYSTARNIRIDSQYRKEKSDKNFIETTFSYKRRINEST